MDTKILPVQTLRGWLSEEQSVSGEFSSPQVYSGPYDVESSTEETLILDTGGRVLSRDIVISPTEIGPNDTATSDDILEGLTAHARGELLVGTIPTRDVQKVNIIAPGERVLLKGFYPENVVISLNDEELTIENIRDGATILGIRGGFTGDATATSSDILEGKTAYAQGNPLIGTIPVNNALVEIPLFNTEIVTKPKGYYKQGFKTYIDTENVENLLGDNIREGVRILGIVGTMRQYTNTEDATATSGDILEGLTAYAQGEKLTGSIPINTSLILISDQQVLKGPVGYYPDGPEIQIDVENVTNLIPENIMAGVQILGVRGIATGGIDLNLASASENDILEGKTAYIASGLTEGTLLLQSEETKEVLIDTPDGESLLGGVYRNGITILVADADQITPEHLIEGVTILGVSGVMKGVAKPYEKELQFSDALTDETGDALMDEDGNVVDGLVIYDQR